MEKVKILNIQKNEHRTLYAFPKVQRMFEIIREIFYKLDFENGPEDNVEIIGRLSDEKSNRINSLEEVSINSKEYDQRIINLWNESYSVDIIFFSKKVVLIFNYKEDKQQEISEAIGEFIEEED